MFQGYVGKFLEVKHSKVIRSMLHSDVWLVRFGGFGCTW